MASIVLSAVGGAMGVSVAGPLGGMVGYTLGSMIGGAIDDSFSPKSYNVNRGSRLYDLIVQTSNYGKVIPIIYGKCRVAGNVIWSLPIQEHQHTETTGGKGGIEPAITSTGYSYTITLAIAICEGKIDSITNIWADAQLLPNIVGRIYNGDEMQLPDSLIEAHIGVGKTPAYRGLAYIVIENFPLAQYGNRIPNFTFEVKRLAKLTHHQSVEDMLKAICIIPGSGEFVYDTKLQYKVNGEVLQQGKAIPINHHNNTYKADAIVALDQLQETCPNIVWVAPVIAWFATSLDIANCKILPGVEFKQMRTEPDVWSSANYTRETAHQLTLINNNHIYGGTSADISIIRYLEELKNRGFKIMFYPMVFVDLPNKPWRGHITGDASHIDNFFEEYNKFILHYAKLVKGKVDAFIIGSELIGITKLIVAIDKFCELADQVKQILGPAVKISYAADWSEYHHSEGGWYYLDKLWASDSIDFVGIDAYFPLTNDQRQEYDEQRIIDGWTSGEGYDFYYIGKNNLPIAPEYAWKNISWWSENEHVNPDNQKTLWRPKSKKIWFTEFGFPSLDCATNQPNVFYNPESCDGGIPIHSKGRVDFRAQRNGISATLKKWANSEMVENMFLWSWDARPYPYWPSLSSVWADGALWLRGHWVNGKFGVCCLGDIITDLCLRSGLISEQFNVSELNDIVEGYVINDLQSAREAIEALSSIYFFYIVESEAKLKFSMRCGKMVQKINEDDLIIVSGGGTISTTRRQELELAKQVSILYMDSSNYYQSNIAYATRENVETNVMITINSQMVLTASLAQRVANINLYNNWVARTSYKFVLPPNYLHLEPGDLITLNHSQMRIININIATKRFIHITAIAEESSNYSLYIEPSIVKAQTINSNLYDHIIHILDLPYYFNAEENQPVIYVAVANKLGTFKPITLCYNHNMINIHNEATIGHVLDALQPSQAIDYNSKIIVFLISGKLESITDEYMINGKNLAIIGDEIIQFGNAKLLEPGKYELSRLLRGRLGTENQISTHKSGDRFILLDHKLQKISMLKHLLGVKCEYKIIAPGQILADGKSFYFTWQGNSLRPLSPANI